MTPYARDVLRAAGLTQADLDAVTPAGWHLVGFGRGPQGPWTFELVADASPRVRPLSPEVTVYRAELVRDAIGGLLASVTEDLETQLRASLAILEGVRK